MFWWLGLPAPLLWGVIMAVLAIIPYLGAFVVWVPAAIFFALEGSWGKALILTAWGGIVVALIDNLVYPILVGKRMRLHTVPVFLAMFGGLALFGASGLILGPVILAVTDALVDIWRRRTAGGQTAEAGLKAEVRGQRSEISGQKAHVGEDSNS
jgi:predicted PurR-regulated permease PerM